MLNNIECRLCSSTTELISLFNGKCRKNRDYIRKLIDITTGIKFQKNDVCKCICFACTIQIYNFYIFRARSIENEKTLQVCTNKGNEKIRSHKIEAVDLDDIVLPDTEELKENLTPWFISKQKYCENENTETDINTINSVNADQDSNVLDNNKLIDSSTQYDLVEHVAVATQYEWSCLERSTQTNKPATKTKKNQCKLGQLDNECKESTTQTSEVDGICDLVEKIDKATQCECSSVDVCTQINPEKNESKDFSMQTYILQTQHETSRLETSTQTNKLATKTKKIQCKLEKPNKKSSKENTNSTTQSSETNSCCNLIEKVDKLTQYECHSVDVCIETNKLINFNESRECSTQTIENKCESTETPNTETQSILSDKDYQPCYTKYSKRNLETPKKDKEINMQTSTPINMENSKDYIYVESFSKETQCDLYILQGYARRKSLMPNTVKIQGILSKSSEKSKVNCTESATQTEITCMGNRAESLCNNYYVPGIMPKRINWDIKQEIETPPMLSPANCLNINLDGTKTEALISPGIGCVSPRSSSLLTLKDKVENVIICPECDRTVYSKSQYKLHRKSHMQCNFCRKKFRSIKRTKLHKEYHCDIQKLTKTVPVVTLIRLESLTDVQKKYPECLDSLKEWKLDFSRANGDMKKVVRIRSRSVSDTDSVINCTACKSCISVLNGVSLGVDKSVQANLIFDKDLIYPLEFVYKNVCLKRELEDGVIGDRCQLKKLKLSASVSS